jgi:hypothetical protein
MKPLLIWMLKMFAIIGTFSQTLVLALTWFTAYFNGDYVIVTINRLGERDPELVMWIACLPLFTYGTWLVMRELWRDGWRRRKRFRKAIERWTGRRYTVETLR